MKYLEKLNGLKTYIGAIIGILTGLIMIMGSLTGDGSDLMEGFAMVSAGIAVFGAGHKMDKLREVNLETQIILQQGNELMVERSYISEQRHAKEQFAKRQAAEKQATN